MCPPTTRSSIQAAGLPTAQNFTSPRYNPSCATFAKLVFKPNSLSDNPMQFVPGLLSVFLPIGRTFETPVQVRWLYVVVIHWVSSCCAAHSIPVRTAQLPAIMHVWLGRARCALWMRRHLLHPSHAIGTTHQLTAWYGVTTFAV